MTAKVGTKAHQITSGMIGHRGTKERRSNPNLRPIAHVKSAPRSIDLINGGPDGAWMLFNTTQKPKR
jgi:hypothetical protein